ncbi:ATP-binding protein [Marivita sp. GX14005]|uniref:ATP-binding protein n=1 Tax=Marivita sp. GX14005 TaxID=2942276 RepID=UPI00201A1827|nr:ATP-binding protein [Marivita sp. GX14005]MCL3881854.1 ATP-binding protein [Marivita sp. GX14005]
MKIASEESRRTLIELCLPALAIVTPDILRRLLRALDAEVGCDVLETVHMVLAEAVNNVVEHAYANRPNGAVAISVSRGRTALTIELRDWGAPMFGIPDGIAPDPSELAEGGYGWFLIRSLTSDVKYDRAGCCNRLVLSLPL